MMCDGIKYNILQAQDIASEGNLKKLALFLIIKSKYSNSCIYNWSVKGLSDEFGFSRQFLKKTIGWFLANNWCRIHGNHLIFNKLRSFDQNKQNITYNITIHSGAKIKEVLYDLRLNLLKYKESKFQYLKKLEGDINRPTNSFVYKSAIRALKKAKLQKDSLPRENSRFTISMNGLAKTYGCSRTMAHKIVSSFKKAGDIGCVSGVYMECFRSSNMAAVKSALTTIKGSYYYNGAVYKSTSNQYYFGV